MKKTIPSIPILAPSLLSADFSNLMKDINEIEKAGIKWLHLDVMDGHFVPNMTFGPVLVESISKKTSLILDCHLMVKEPEKFISWFAKAGADLITIHAEAVADLPKTLKLIHESGCLAGVSVKPGTPIESIFSVLSEVDLVLVMSVEPGFGGQSFMPNSLDKVKKLSKIKTEKSLNFLIEIDGGINELTARECRAAGVEVFVAGNSVFGKSDRANAILKLNEAIRS